MCTSVIYKTHLADRGRGSLVRLYNDQRGGLIENLAGTYIVLGITTICASHQTYQCNYSETYLLELFCCLQSNEIRRNLSKTIIIRFKMMMVEEKERERSGREDNLMSTCLGEGTHWG